MNNRPLRAKNSPPAGWVTDLKRSVRSFRRLRQLGRCGAGKFGRWSLHDDGEAIETLEGIFERAFTLAPADLIGQQRVDVGIDGEVFGRIVAAAESNEQTQQR